MSNPPGQTETDSPTDTSVPLLQPHISKKYALSWVHVVACGFFATLFAILNHLPLHHSNIWGHVLYGESILDSGQIPVEDPFVPLAEGMSAFDSAWLSQVIFAGVANAGGDESLSFLFAAVVTATCLLLAVTFFLQTRRVGLSVFGVMLVLVFASTRIRIIRPEIFGVFCFAGLALLTNRVGRSAWKKGETAGEPTASSAMVWATYVGVLLLMMLWANLHDSFLVGVGFLACHCLGRILEVAWQTKSPRAVLADRLVRRWLWLTELAILGSLCNPGGMEAVVNALTIRRNPNLQGLAEWGALQSEMVESYWLAISVVVLLFVARHSRVVFRPADVLLLAVFAAVMVFSVRMCVWYAVVFGVVMMPHLADFLARFWPLPPPQEESEIVLGGGVFGRSFIHTLVCGLLIWCGFALSPSSQPILGGDPRKDTQLYSNETPLSAAAYLQKHPPIRLIWNPQWWGDWLLRNGPADLQVFSTSHAVHVVPPLVWQDHMRILRGENGWLQTVDKYRIDTLVIDKSVQSKLDEQARTLTDDWVVLFEDAQVLIVSRDKALKAAVADQ